MRHAKKYIREIHQWYNTHNNYLPITMYLELHCSHSSSNEEDISFVNWTISFKEVRLQKHVKQVPSDALHCIIDGEDMNPLPVLHIRKSCHTYVSQHTWHLVKGHFWNKLLCIYNSYLTTSPSLTRKFCLTTRFIRIFSLLTVSSDNTMQT